MHVRVEAGLKDEVLSLLSALLDSTPEGDEIDASFKRVKGGYIVDAHTGDDPEPPGVSGA